MTQLLFECAPNDSNVPIGLLCSQARPKYLRCIAIACFFLAAKTCEEDEVNAVGETQTKFFLATLKWLSFIQGNILITKCVFVRWQRVPSLKELAASSSCGCSPSEILRMERLVLDKLNWDLHTATALDFLHIVSLSHVRLQRPLRVSQV